MRLTLRTMLAYLDEILEPADAKALGAKIDESEFATALVHRIRSCTRRLRLGAPKLDGKGMGLDPNTVAEYLDNTLAQDRVPDFEKVCLESDVHLAEVASCHQILTLVLGEPATVEPHLRDKIYHLPEIVGVAATHGAEEPAGIAASTNGSSALGEKPDIITKRPQVPDYLRVARRRSWTSVAATITLALLLIIAALLALGRLDETHPLLGPFLQKPVATKENQTKQSNRRTPDARKSSATTQQDNDATTDGAAASTVAEIAAAASEEDQEDAAPSTTSSNDVTAAESAADSTESELPPAPPNTASSTDATESAVRPSLTTIPDEPAADEATTDEGPAPSTETSSAPDSASPDATTSATPENPSPESVVEVGRFLSASDRKHVLARFDVQNGWVRVPEREVLHAGDELLVLPSYRPQIALTSGVQLTLVGPSRITLERPDASNAPVLGMRNASALIDNSAITGSRIFVDLPDRRAEIVFATPDATLAIHVQRNWPLGVDPEQDGSPYICRLMATIGQLEWREGSGEAIVINSGQTLIAVGAEKPTIVDDMSIPDWASANEVRDIELRASKELEMELQKAQEGDADSDRGLTLTLREKINHRQVEVAALAISSLASMYEFEPALVSLRDEKFRSYWRSQYDVIQWALSSDNEAVKNLRAALEKNRPEDAKILYRLTWGYTNEQLAGGEDKKLVDLLEDRSMDVRVLTFENLRRITNHPGTYRPEKDPAGQRRVLQEWKGMLEKEQIRWAE